VRDVFSTKIRYLCAASVGVLAAAMLGAVSPGPVAEAGPDIALRGGSPRATTTPIKHLVVIFDENISYDHYFGTYPHAANTDGTPFRASRRTAWNNNLVTAHLLRRNPNLYTPHRLSADQASTCDQNHNYLPEQKAANGGRNDKFVENVSVDTCSGLYGSPGLTMDYYDGNTVTAMWNYAQHFALSDNFYDSVFGPSTPGAINLISGNTHGVQAVKPDTLQPTIDPSAVVDPDANGIGTMIADPDPAYDDCSNKSHTASNNLAVMHGANIGDRLNERKVTWGWFQGGFRPTTAATDSSPAACLSSHPNLAGASVVDYSPHHEPFQYYPSTANRHHVPPSSVAAIGHTDQANHQYDLTDFDAAAAAGNLPAVSFLKAAQYQDGHAGYSDPIGEQHFLVNEINRIQTSPQWASTAIVIAYDDSDGWYDHQSTRLLNGSNSPTGNDYTFCAAAAGTAGVAGGYLDRCGPGPRLPMLVISPYAKRNHVDHQQLEQTSIIKFIEQNWQTQAIGDFSFDARAKPITSMFDFRHPQYSRLLLNGDGSIRRGPRR
jgi:phospholipase C